MVTQIEPVTPRHLFQDDFTFMASTYSTRIHQQLSSLSDLGPWK